MLAELRMKIETDNPDFGYYQSSTLQGVLMQHIRTEYAGRLHEQGLKPYSQHLLIGEEKEWVVKTCTQEAYQEIILPLMDSGFAGFTIEKKNMRIRLKEKLLKTVKKKELMDEFYSDSVARCLKLEFLTPTSFKSGGKYMIY